MTCSGIPFHTNEGLIHVREATLLDPIGDEQLSNGVAEALHSCGNSDRASTVPISHIPSLTWHMPLTMLSRQSL